MDIPYFEEKNTNHFQLQCQVEVNNRDFGWLCFKNRDFEWLNNVSDRTFSWNVEISQFFPRYEIYAYISVMISNRVAAFFDTARL